MRSHVNWFARENGISRYCLIGEGAMAEPDEQILKKSALALREWAKYGGRYIQPQRADWKAIQRLIKASQSVLKLKRGDVERLLDQSDIKLEPLGDPLRIDFGAHRWLAGKREENYSDWLKWIVEQIWAKRVCEIFKIPNAIVSGCKVLTAEREVWVDKGHEGQGGRLDLVIRDLGKSVIIVEVKLTGAESADTKKQEGYKVSVKKQYHEPNQHFILLVTDAQEPECDGFTVLKWSDLCLGLRKLVVEEPNSKLGLIAKAMILAFVGAVEQNLLGYSISGAVNSFNSSLLEYLRKFIEEGE